MADTSTLFTVYGTPGDDFIIGTNGNDLLDGGDGSDQLLGLAGNDVLIGGSGFDNLDGGSGDDTYAFAAGDGVDVIWAGAGTPEAGAPGTAGGRPARRTDPTQTVAGRDGLAGPARDRLLLRHPEPRLRRQGQHGVRRRHDSAARMDPAAEDHRAHGDAARRAVLGRDPAPASGT